jgi:hypothetical protein
MYMGSPTDTGAGATVSVLLALDDRYDFAGKVNYNCHQLQLLQSQLPQFQLSL